LGVGGHIDGRHLLAAVTLVVVFLLCCSAIDTTTLTNVRKVLGATQGRVLDVLNMFSLVFHHKLVGMALAVLEGVSSGYGNSLFSNRQRKSCQIFFVLKGTVWRGNVIILVPLKF
jgi:hypothetical protein